MELLGRLGAVIGISLVLTMLLLVLYQDDSTQQFQPESTTISQQAAAAIDHGTPYRSGAAAGTSVPDPCRFNRRSAGGFIVGRSSHSALAPENGRAYGRVGDVRGVRRMKRGFRLVEL